MLFQEVIWDLKRIKKPMSKNLIFWKTEPSHIFYMHFNSQAWKLIIWYRKWWKIKVVMGGYVTERKNQIETSDQPVHIMELNLVD